MTPSRDGPLPLVIWAYPLDYGDAGTAGQVRGTTERFTRLTAGDPVWFVLRGYAVLQGATMPVIGDPETMNDTYVEQITAAAAAHISALAELGVADPQRVAVGGHSYGAFMTANLLAHTDLFAAGIARSGAYNRSLTPFGFQAERRSFWEATSVYDRMSPFRYADQITLAPAAHPRRARRQLRHVPDPVGAAVPGDPGHRRHRPAGGAAATRATAISPASRCCTCWPSSSAGWSAGSPPGRPAALHAQHRCKDSTQAGSREQGRDPPLLPRPRPAPRRPRSSAAGAACSRHHRRR